MQLECRYTFHLPPGKRLLVRRSRGQSPEEWRFATDRSDVIVIVEIPAKESAKGQEASLKVAWNDPEGWEVWAIPHFKVYVLTEHDMDADGDHPWRESLPGIESQIDPLATAAASNFLRTVRWRAGQYWLPEHLALSEASASIEFYEGGQRIPYGRFELPASLPATATALSQSSRETIEEDLRNNRQPTLPEVLLLDAMLYGSLTDYRVALMLA